MSPSGQTSGGAQPGRGTGGGASLKRARDEGREGDDARGAPKPRPDEDTSKERKQQGKGKGKGVYTGEAEDTEAGGPGGGGEGDSSSRGQGEQHQQQHLGQREQQKAQRDREKEIDKSSQTTVDAAAALAAVESTLNFQVISNDGSPKHMMMLTTLKNIFAKQLPKMPKDYIVRLVFDRKHRSMALCKGDTPIGGVCYRPYPAQRFGEIAFCAVTTTEQVKGYGTRLMNALKEHVKGEGTTHFLTYADNYAIGYFKKQGFSKVIAMPKDRWYGYIKDYDGGTLMECYVHPTVPFNDAARALELQQEFVRSKVRQRAKAHIVYPGLQCFRQGGKVVDLLTQIPGLLEAGWTAHTITADSSRNTERERGTLTKELISIWTRVQLHDSAWPFKEPVDFSVVPDYASVVKDPIDLSTMKDRLDRGDYYKSKKMLKADMQRMLDNCRLYNEPHTKYYKCADEVEAFLKNHI